MDPASFPLPTSPNCFPSLGLLNDRLWAAQPALPACGGAKRPEHVRAGKAEGSWAPGRTPNCLQKSVVVELLPVAARAAWSSGHAGLPATTGGRAGAGSGSGKGSSSRAARQGGSRRHYLLNRHCKGPKFGAADKPALPQH